MGQGWGRVAQMALRWHATAGVAVLCAAAALSTSCAAALLSPSGGRWVHPKLGYSIEAPSVSPEEWTASEVDGADLSFQKRDGSSLTMMSDCERGAAHPALLARQLLIGTRQRELLVSHPIAHRGDPGWRLVFRTTEADRDLTVNSVTVVSGACTFDWLWIAVGIPSEATWFDRWWASFERGAQR